MVEGIEKIRDTGWLAMDVAFIHAPQNIMRKAPAQFYIMPMGVIMLSNVLNEEGYRSRVFHLGIEQEHNQSPEEVISRIRSPIFALDIHWYVHLYDAVQTAALCKKIHPDSTIIVGGMTASCFATDLMSEFPFIDIVIRGDAERPFLQAVTACLKECSLEGVPNIMYRERGNTISNPLQYVAGEEELSLLPYVTDHLPVNHVDTYFHREMNGEPCFPTFWFCCGRGCMYNCCWCGGAASAHKRLAGRSAIIKRTPEAVAGDIVQLSSRLNAASLSHDVVTMGMAYASHLFSLIKKETLDIGCYWEVFNPSLYSKEVLLEIARTFNPQRSRLAVSLGSAVPNIRKKSGMARFSNSQLYTMLRQARSLGIQVEGYFHILPADTYDTFEATLQFVESVQRDLKIPFFYWSATLDPESPMHVTPEAFDLCSRMRIFKDYWHKSSENRPFVGYDLKWFEEETLLSLSAGHAHGLPESVADVFTRTTEQRNALVGLGEDSDLAEALFV
jgi:radical SAM superfamily enzyme YgiQ (UPF0313 family)